MATRRASSRPAPRSKRSSRSRSSRRAVTKPKAPGATTNSGLAPGMQTVNTYLAVANVAATIEFLERAFGFTRGVTLPGTDGQLRYAEMRHGGSVIMLIPKGDPSSATHGSAALYTYVADVDGLLARARDAGAGVGEAEDTPWGDRTAAITDPDGYRWVLATFKKLAPFT